MDTISQKRYTVLHVQIIQWIEDLHPRIHMNVYSTRRRKDQMEHTKQHIQKPFWYVFSFCWSRWIIFSRIDVWPLNLFMCIFDKIPITFFKFPSISSFFLFLYSQHSSFCEDAILLNVQKIFKPDNQQTISPFCHPGHFNFRQTKNFTDPILYHLLFYVSLRGK